MTEFPIRQLPKMFCFGGKNATIQIDKIKNIEAMYYEDYATDTYTPILHFYLADNTVIIVDYETIEEAEKALKEYKKFINFKIIK